VILLDELSRAPLMTNNILFPCLDVRRQLPVEIADSHHDRVIKVHPECTFIATANIGSEYSGTNEIDAALLNRFLPLQLDYLPANIEQEILTIRTKIDSQSAAEVVARFNTIRMAYNENRISKTVSTRELIACGELIADGFTVNEALDFVVCQKFLNTSYQNELTTVKRILSSL
jgi:MoxR-like ATPase